MIITNTKDFFRYVSLNPFFSRTFEYIEDLYKNGDSALGKQEILGENLFCILAEDQAREVAPRLEAHRKYIDIQFALEGSFNLGWKSLTPELVPETPYDETKDLIFFKDTPELFVEIAPKTLCILFPEDTHAPMPPMAGKLFKGVMKVKL